MTGGGSGGPGIVNAGIGGTVILGGSFSGTLTGSGAGAVQLSDFTGAGATLNFTGTVLQWAPVQNGPGLAGTVTNKGALLIATSGGNLYFTGTLTNTGSIAVTGTNNIFANATSTTIDNQSGATFDFQAGAILNVNGFSGTSFNNAGLLERSTGTGTAVIEFPVNDSGTIAGNSGTLDLTGGGSGSPGIVNAGTGGTVILGGSFSGTLTGSGAGAVQLSDFTGAGATLNFTGSVLQWAPVQNGADLAGTVTNTGALLIATSGGNLYLAGTLTNTGSIAVTGTNNIFANAISTTIDNQVGATFDFQAGATLSVNGFSGTAFNNAGTLERSTGSGTALIGFPVNNTGTIAGDSGTLQLTGGTGSGSDAIDAAGSGIVILGGGYSGNFVGSGSGAVQLSNFTGTGSGVTLDFSGGVLQWNTNGLGGTITNAGALTVSGNSALPLTGTLNNTGAIEDTSTGYIYANASGTAINNLAGGTFDFQSATSLTTFGNSSLAFNNAGLLERSTGSGTAEVDFPVNNTGTIEGHSGTLTLDGGGSGGSNDTVTATAGGIVILSGSYTGTFAGSGAGAVQLSNFTGGGSGATLDFSGGVLQWNTNGLGGTITSAGTLTISGNAAQPLTGTLNNTGTIVDRSTGYIYANASGTTINNLAGATFDFQSATSVITFGNSNTAFNNDGTLELSGGASSTQIAFAMGGAGNVVIDSGTLTIDSGTLEFDNSALLAIAPAASLTIDGNLSGSTLNVDQFAPAGSVLFNGSGTSAAPQLLEVMSQDLGNVGAGFQNNFAYGTLALGNSTYVQLTDNTQNVTAAGSQADALYVNALVVPSGCTLDLHGLNVYARQIQDNGTIVGGTVRQLPAGGPLVLNSPAPGLISQTGQVDDWTFYGQAGQTVAVVVNTGSSGSLSPLVPTLGYAQVQVLDPNGNVVASGTNTQQGADVTLAGITLATNGTYKIEVQAPSSHSGSTGNYLVTEWDGNTHANALDLGETENGQLNSPYASDQWSFSAPANEAIQFNLTGASSSAIEFDLTGPNGYTAFKNQPGSSGAINLPTAGTYTLTAHLAADQPGAYAFNVAVSSATALTPGTPFNGTLAGTGQEQLFTVTLANPAALSIVLSDSDAQDENELYVSSGTAPTRDTYQFSASGPGADQTVALAAEPGTYYILVYNSLVSSPGSHYSLEVQAPPFVWTGFTPGKVGSAVASTVLVSGIFPLAYQSSKAYQIQFVSSGGSVFPSTPVFLGPTELSLGSSSSTNPNGTQTLSVTLPANTLPAGTYSVKITDSNHNTQTLSNALSVTAGGTGVLSTKLIIPHPIGFHYASTLYIQYTNTGTAPMAAPLLELSATINGQQGAFLSLDPSLAGHYYSSNTMPAGLSPTVQFVANGSIPGVLEPGETVTVPVYQDGWLLPQQDLSGPPIIFTVSELSTTNSSTIDWSSLEASMRPSTINQTAWSAIFPVLTANLGSTWGQYLQTLDNDAVYLASIGEPTTDLNALLTFEIEKANAVYTADSLVSVTVDDLPAPGMDLTFEQSFQQSISGRDTQGILGLGWTTNWDISATTMPNGDVVIDNSGTLEYFSLQADGSFAPPPTLLGTTLSDSGGAVKIVDPDGTTYRFNSNGTLNDIEDTHGNSITAGYNAQGQLATLTDSNGEYFHLAYNSQGFVSSLTDSNGTTESYSYDTSGHLITYADEYGTTTYSYVSGQSPAQNNALSEIAYADNTHIFFAYDSDGRLVDQHRDNGQEDETWTYLSPGGYTTTDANGNASTDYFNLYGAPAETIDPLGNVTRFYYDSNQNLTKVIGPGGLSATATYDASGNVLSSTDPLGLTTTFTYDANDNLTSYTDAKGNTTSYAYDAQNDLLSVTYANGAQQQATYNPLGEATQYVIADGQAIGSTYNAQGLLATETFADGTSYSYTYDARGNLLTAIDSSGTTTFSYTAPGNPDLLTKVAYPDGTFLEFTYNIVAQRTQSVDQTGFTVNYTYDALGRLSELTDGSGNLIVQYTYDAAGNLSQKDNGNGTRTVYTYDGDGDVLSITNYAAASGPVNSFDNYTYDALGNVLTDTSQDGEWVYSYDADSQLKQAVFTPNATDPDGLTAQNLQYVYDAAGNRISETVNGVVTTYVVNNVNEYTSSTTSGVTTSYQYDPDGNLIAQTGPSGTTNYTFNELDQLTAVNGPGLSASYGYDALGNLYSSTQNGQQTEYLTDPQLGNVVGQFTSGGGALVQYTYGLGLVSQVSAASGVLRLQRHRLDGGPVERDRLIHQRI